jgi:DNA-directed RNA polymerase specialized sigma24 family protein
MTSDTAPERPSGSVTAWLADLRDGKSQAAHQLWNAYFAKLVAHADRTLGARPRRTDDEEDVALSVFKSVCLGAREGRFPKLQGRNDLWPLLVAISAHKVADRARHDNRRKRGGDGGAGSARPWNKIELDELLAREPPPEVAAEAADELRNLLDRLDATGDPLLRRIAAARLEGWGPAEIATKLDCARRTIERKLELVERLWSEIAQRAAGEPATGDET